MRIRQTRSGARTRRYCSASKATVRAISFSPPRLTATNDADASNNLHSVTVDLAPNVDVRVDAPPPRRTCQDRSEVPDTPSRFRRPRTRYRTSTRSIEGTNLDVELVSISQGNCAQVSAIECALGTLPANSAVQMELDLTALELGPRRSSCGPVATWTSIPATTANGELLHVLPTGKRPHRDEPAVSDTQSR